MARKHLASEEMLHISANWIDPTSPAHQAILASPDLAHLLSRISSAHEDLSKNAQPVQENGRFDAISKEQAALDLRHDELIRGSHALLSGIAALVGPEHGQAITELRDQLIPEGLSSTQKTYAAEAGQAAQLNGRLTPEIRALTSKIRPDPHHASHTLTHFLDEWIQIGKQLGALEDEKTRLAPPDRSPATLIAARNKWIRTVNLMLASAEAADIDPNMHNTLFGSLLHAEAKAAKRSPKPLEAPPNQPDPSLNPTPEPTQP